MTHSTLNRRHLLAGTGAALALAKPSGVFAAPAVSRSYRRLQGDPVTLKFAHMNSWNAEWTADLDTMVADAWRWQRENPAGYREAGTWEAEGVRE